MTIQAILTIIIFICVIILLIWKPVHPIVIGAAIPIALSVLKITDPSKAFADFANTTVIFFMSLLVIGAAIFKTGLADFIGEKMISLTGTSEKGINLGSGIVAAVLSAFLNDTGTTGCLIPIVGSMGRKAGIKLSKVYLALAFFSSVGGTITLIGTTPHIVANGLLEDSGYAGFGFFEFAKIGIPIAVAGLIYMYFFGIKLLPEKEAEEEMLPALANRNVVKMVIVAAVFLFVIVCMATGLLPMHVAAAVGALLVVLTGCITVEEAIKSFSVSTLFLVAGIFPLSSAMVNTGAADYLVHLMSAGIGSFSPFVTLALITGFTIITTQFLMNTSLTAILVPIGIMIAQSAGLNPRGVVMAIAIASSAAFCTPFGTGPNLLVWETGGYDFKDYVKVGLPFAVIFWVISSVLVYIFYIA